MAENDHVEDDEELYRNVRYNWNPPHYSCKNGNLTIEPHAFWDECKKPSVDRAKLLNCDPRRALIEQKPPRKRNSIVSIRAGAVRTITDVVTKTDDRTTKHDIDVVPSSTDDRPAHAEITVDPEFLGSRTRQEKTFKDLQKSLARRANDFIAEHGWALPLPK